jgi:hypothetical protein
MKSRPVVGGWWLWSFIPQSIWECSTAAQPIALFAAIGGSYRMNQAQNYKSGCLGGKKNSKLFAMPLKSAMNNLLSRMLAIDLPAIRHYSYHSYLRLNNGSGILETVRDYRRLC